VKGFALRHDQSSRNTKRENETIENRTMKKTLCSLVAVLSLASAAFADHAPAVHLRVVGESAGLPQTDVMKWVGGKQAMHSRALVG